MIPTLPRWAWYALGAAVLVLAALAYIHHRERKAVEADRTASNAAAVSTARQADERAQQAANRTTEEVSDANDRARVAAENGDDPLGDGLRSLRQSGSH